MKGLIDMCWLSLIEDPVPRHVMKYHLDIFRSLVRFEQINYCHLVYHNFYVLKNGPITDVHLKPLRGRPHRPTNVYVIYGWALSTFMIVLLSLFAVGCNSRENSLVL